KARTQEDVIGAYPRREGELAPTSWGQQRLWFINRLEGSNPAYHITVSISLLGKMDAGVLQRALNSIVRRHEVLRAKFVGEAQDLKMHIAPEASLRLEVVDLSECQGEARDALLQ